MRPVVLCLVLLLLSVARAEDEIRIERDGDAVVVRSPISARNFLFRAPGAFAQTAPPEGFAAALEAAVDGATARIRLRIGARGDVPPREWLDRRVKEYAAGYGAPSVRSGKPGRWEVHAAGPEGERTVVVVFDGETTYELFLEAAPADTALAESLVAVGAGFTILDPKGAPPGSAAAPSAEELAARTLEKAYYRLKLLKPLGFAQEAVDPNEDPGIVFRFRRQDEEKNLCVIHVRVFLERTLTKDVAERAQAALDRFAKRYQSPKVPRKPKRARWPGAREAYQLKLLGRAPKSSVVVQEDWRLIDHENGRVYEIQMTQYGAAARVFKKEIRAFWRKLKITNPP